LEYILLVALLISIGAMGTDIMLPAMKAMGAEFGVQHANDVHLIITAFFLGMAIGQLIVGPLSDRYGRKPIILFGYLIFIVGCALSMFTTNWTMMLAGRVIQGIGAAAPRIVTMALVRDEFEGRAMARILSIVMALFITVPILAPAIGQGLIYVSGWRATFAALIVLAILASVWFYLRQAETLAPSNRRSIDIRHLWQGFIEVVRTRITLGYTLATGLVYGMFVGYLGSAQQIFQDVFGVGDLFALYFALASLSLGTASLVNAKLVMRLGMRKLNWIALLSLSALSLGFWFLLFAVDGVPSIELFLIWQLSTFFCVGIVFGNINAIALQPLGHIAGLAAAFVGSMATFISLPLAWIIGKQFDNTVFPLVAGFAVLGLAACVVVACTEKASAA